VNQGKLKVLAVTTSKRSALMPSVPTLDESGLKGYQRMRMERVPRAGGRAAGDHHAAQHADREDRQRARHEGSDGEAGPRVQTTTPEEFAAFIRSERAQNAKLVKFAGIKIE
jgi:tripartite-type tricarboxylate transporter receptor subunit TctC